MAARQSVAAIERDPQPNFCAGSWALLRMPCACRRCGCATHAAAYWLPPGHEVLTSTDDEQMTWDHSRDCRLLHRVVWLDPAARRLVGKLWPGVRPAPVAAYGACWVAHCEHCGAPVAALDEDPGEFIGWWASQDPQALLEVLPILAPLTIEAYACSVGDLADAPLAALLQAEPAAPADQPGR